jgi:lipopolysaccharide exporter
MSHSSLTRQALGGVAWNYAGAGVLVVTQIASTAVTARVVSPGEFGAYATAQAAAGIFGYFTLAAVAQGVLRRTELATGTVGTALGISLGAGGLVAAAMWVAAGPWADAWHVPAAERVVHVLALTVFLNSTAVMPLALLRRSLRFRTAALAETGTQVVGAAVGVALAVELHSAFALALGQCAAAAILLLATGLLVRRELELRFSLSEAKSLAAFAGQVSAINFGSYLMNTAPSLYAARAYGARTLGIYSRANVIVGLPSWYLSSGLVKVLYPLYGKVRSDESRVKVLLDEALTLSSGLVWPTLAFIGGASPLIVRVLLGPGWGGAASLLTLFALGYCADMSCGLLTNAGEAFGWMRTIWLRQVAFLTLIVVDIGVMQAAGLGVEALVAGLALAQWLTYAVTVQAFVRRGFLEAHKALSMNAVHGCVAAIAFGAAAICARSLASAPLAVGVVGEVITAAVVCGALVLGRAHFPGGRVLDRRVRAVSWVRGAAV